MFQIDPYITLVGETSCQSDGGVFANSNIGYCITKDIFPLLCPRALDTSGTVFPYVFVADDTFPLCYNMVKPYAETDLDIRKLIAYYHISRARRVIENAFGILAARFRVFRRPIHAKVNTTESITKACVALHNFLMVGRQYGTIALLDLLTRKLMVKNLMGNGEVLFMVIHILPQLRMLAQVTMARKQKMCMMHEIHAKQWKHGKMAEAKILAL